MSEVVIEIHTISSANGWYFSEFGGIEPVLCFALVSILDTDHPTISPAKQVIALDKDHFGDILGMTVEEKHTDIEFRELKRD